MTETDEMEALDLIGDRVGEKYNLVRMAMKLWYLKTMMQKAKMLPTPQDAPESRGWSGTGWRVLLVGNGATHGWGVSSHRDSLTGQIAEQLTRKSGRPVNVDYVGDELMNAQSALAWLKDIDLSVYDEVILLLGWNDAVRMTPMRIWKESVTGLLLHLTKQRRSDAGLVVVGIEPMGEVSGYYGLPGKVAQRHADRLNAEFLRQVGGQRETFMTLSERKKRTGQSGESILTYQQWAKEIAKVAAGMLPKGEPQSELDGGKSNFSWIGAERMLGRTSKEVLTRLLAIEAEARKTFKVQMAQVTLLEGGRQWFPNHVGAAPASAPRCLTYCDVAARQPEALIVPNAKRDARFKNNPYLEQTHMPFYAGQALVSRSGEVVGTFCLLDALPRPKILINRKKLASFVQRAQEEIWRIEDEAMALQERAQRPYLIERQPSGAESFDI